MLSPRSLRGRLVLAYASALIVALVVFAASALAVVDREQRAALDARLRSVGDAFSLIGDQEDGRFTIDAKDRKQFFTLLGAQAQGAILLNDGSIAVSSNEGVTAGLAATAGTVARPVAMDARAGNEGVRLFAQPLIDGNLRVGTAYAWSDLDGIDALDRRVAFAFMLAIPAIAAIAILAGGSIARRGLAPLESVADLASAIEAHDLSQRLGTISPDRELQRLSATIDRMLDRLAAAFLRERQFTSDASHEIRAPLSVIRAEAELAARGKRSVDEYRRALETIVSEADALEALTRDLLSAARGGNGMEDVQQRVDLGDVAEALAERFGPVAGSRRISVARPFEGTALVAANRALLESAVVSALQNAIKYAPERGTVAIDVGLPGNSAALTITDDGPGFSQEALTRAFDRFWRDDEARARDGHGLGLSIAKTIVERFGGTIAVANAEPHGAVVRMTFPRMR